MCVFRYELAQSQVEQGKYILADTDLQEREEEWEKERSDMAKKRFQKERQLSDQALRRKKTMLL